MYLLLKALIKEALKYLSLVFGEFKWLSLWLHADTSRSLHSLETFQCKSDYFEHAHSFYYDCLNVERGGKNRKCKQSTAVLNTADEKKRGNVAQLWHNNTSACVKGTLVRCVIPDSEKLFITEKYLNPVAALPEVHLLPHHGAPHTEETPQVMEGSTVEGVFICAAVFEVGDAVA